MTGTLIALAGAAGAGKSALARQRWLPGQVYSRDWARATAGAAPNDVSPGVLADADDLLELIAGMRVGRAELTVIDSTGTADGLLERLLHVGRAHGARCELVIVDTPLVLCVARQAGRLPARQVPDPTITSQHAQVTAMIARHTGRGPEPWDHVEIVPGAVSRGGDR